MVYIAQDSDFEKINNCWIYKGTETEVEIPEYINGELVTSTAFMFDANKGATSVTKVVLRHNHVTTTFAMFYKFNSSAPLLDLSEFNTSNVTDMSNMFRFSFYSGLLDLSGFDTSNVTNMENMFTLNSNLTILDLSNFDISNVTNMSGMFSGCSKLQKIYARTKGDAERLRERAIKCGISPKFYIREKENCDFKIALVNDEIESIFLKDNNGELKELKIYREKIIEV